jgi:N-acetylglucosamine-6-phosphate deacetylase
VGADRNHPQVLIARQLITPNEIIYDAAVIVENQKITAVGRKDEVNFPEMSVFSDFGTKIIAPGLIDVHIHGFEGVEAGKKTSDALHIAKAIARHGTTSFLPTVSFAPTLDEILHMLEATAQAVSAESDGARILGIHLEAPFLSKVGIGPWDRYPPAGFLAGTMAREPSIEELRLMAQAAGGHIKIMSIAPELEGALGVIEEMVRLGIVPSAAHTAASYEQVVAGIEAGLKSATHLYNGMRRQDHREPGVIEAVLSKDELMAEIIGDCVHVHPPAIDIAIRCKGTDRIVLVTDNTRYAGMPNGLYKDDMGRDIVKDDEKAYVPGWTLAGSVSPLNHNVHNMIARVGHSLPEAIKIASLTPARLLGVADRKGSLEVGKDADLIVIDDRINVYATMVHGNWVYDAGEIEPHRKDTE